MRINKIISKLFMNAKYNEEVICGWANENETNEDAIRLTNILKRKSAVQVLPQLHFFKNKAETEHRNQQINLKMMPTKGKLYRKSHNNLKIKRQKTQGYDERQSASPNFKNEKIYNAIRLEQCQQYERVTLGPYLTDCQLDERLQRQSNLSEFEANSNNIFSNAQKNKQHETTFLKTLKPKMTGIKSHEFIPHLTDKSQSPKKNQSKHYVKLSSLQMVNDLRRQFRNDFLQRFGTKPCMSEQRDYHEERNKLRGRNGADIYEKINQKFKQTFIKQDIFNKNRRKADKTDKFDGKIDCNEHGIFIDPSIVPDKQILEAKIQSLRSPQKCRLNNK